MTAEELQDHKSMFAAVRGWISDHRDALARGDLDEQWDEKVAELEENRCTTHKTVKEVLAFAGKVVGDLPLDYGELIIEALEDARQALDQIPYPGLLDWQFLAKENLSTEGEIATAAKQLERLASTVANLSMKPMKPGKPKRKRRRVGTRRLTPRQKEAMDLKNDRFTLGQIAKRMDLRNESSVVALLKRGEASERHIEAEVRREQASGRSIRPNVSLDSLEGGKSDD